MKKRCVACGSDADKTYTCEHTGGAEMCKECYEEVHWALNNPASRSSVAAPDDGSRPPR